jgi:hypothetical protein
MKHFDERTIIIKPEDTKYYFEGVVIKELYDKALRECKEENEVNSKSKSDNISEEMKIGDFDSNFLNTENERG